MKRIVFLVCTISTFIFSSCGPEPTREQRMQDADANTLFWLTLYSTQNPPLPGTEEAVRTSNNDLAAAASKEAGERSGYTVPAQPDFSNISVPRNLLLEFNPYEEDGDMHNDALAFIQKEKLETTDLLDKLQKRDKETIDKFLQLNPKFADENVRKQAVDALAAMEVQPGVAETVNKIINAKDYVESISYLGLPKEERDLLTEVYATCNDCYINKANFETVAGYLNGKITSLLRKGKDITVKDQQLARTFTILKHSYYYWHGRNE